MALHIEPKKILGLFFRDLCPGCSERPPSAGSRLCAWCLARVHPVPFAIDAPRPAAFLHSGVMREMMIRLKYSGERHLASVLAEMAVGEWETLPAPGETVTCVPSSRRTMRRRGYNQVSLIARHVCGLTGGRFTGLLSRNPGPSQVGLTAAERRLNLSGAFRVSSRVPPGRIWLIDDVRATGETIARARLALLRGGAGEVVCLAVNFRETGTGSMLRPGEEEREITAGRED